MFTKEFSDFVRVLLNKTSLNEISWEKYNQNNPSAFSLEAKITDSGLISSSNYVQVIIDQYNSSQRDKTSTCVNLAIVDKKGNILQEVVRCNSGSDDYLADFSVLENFYIRVRANYEHFKVLPFKDVLVPSSSSV